MGVVSVRLDDKDEAFLRRRKLSVGTVAREAVHERVRRLEIEEGLAFLAKVSWTPKRPAQDEIRELRDARTVRG